MPVKLACLPVSSEDTVWVKSGSIYPTARILTRLSPEGKIVTTTVGNAEKFKPKRKKPTIAAMAMPGNLKDMAWTIPELASMFSVEQAEIEKLIAENQKAIYHVGSRLCIISGDRLPAYTADKRFAEAVNSQMNNVCEDTIPKLEQEYNECSLCPLGQLRRDRDANLVFGRGPDNAIGLIIAESPWVFEEKDAIPLHPEAKAGDVLYRVMRSVGLSQEDWFLTNSIICRPLREPDGDLADNKPETSDIEACSTRLKRTLRIVSPKLVVLLGSVAYQAWFKERPKNGIMKNLGWKTMIEDGIGVNYHVFVTCHPSFVARKEDSSGKAEVQRMYLSHWQEIRDAFRALGGKIHNGTCKY